MNTEPPLILIIGAADTGRAPIAAALLDRLLSRRGLEWRVASAGVVGHDDQPAQPEARDAITILGLDIGQHRARSLSAALADQAHVLLATDSGVARVLHARHPQATSISLGEIAGSRRDIPDPFRMQVGAWLNYAREIETLLSAGLDRLVALVSGEPAPAPAEEPPPRPPAAPEPPQAEPRRAAVERCLRLLALLAELPGAIDWPGARRQIETDLPAMSVPLNPSDMARPYAAIIQAMLGLSPEPPSPGQTTRLREALAALYGPVTSDSLAALSGGLAGYLAL